MRVIVLGSAAGGGVPQWNCACDNCRAARSGDGVAARTQDSLAVSADGRRWFLLNASPDLPQQLARSPELAPHGRGERRRSPIAGVVITNGDLDHCLGLLSLREWTPLSLYATGHTRAGLVEHNAMFRTLQRRDPHFVHRALPLHQAQPLLDGDDRDSGLRVRAIPVEGKLPLHLQGLMEPTAETNVGLVVEHPASATRIVYVPSARSVDGIREAARGAQVLFFDGTFWSEAELSRLERAAGSASEMAHLPVSGPGGSLEQLASLAVEQRIFTHVNNTNPMLRRGSPERALVERRGWVIAVDGLELEP